MAKEKIEQPSTELQEILDSVMEAEPESVVFNGRKRKIDWLSKGTIRKYSHIIAKEKDEWKRSVKVCAIMLLNNVWKIRLFYWLYWRWLYYIKDLNPVEVLCVVDAAKKKIPLAAFSLITILLTAMTDLTMTMTKKEVSAIQAGQVGEQHSH